MSNGGIVAGFIEVDENHNWFTEDNINDIYARSQGRAPRPGSLGDIIVMPAGAAPPAPAKLASHPDASLWGVFKKRSTAISSGHTPGITMKVGQRVRWSLMGSTNSRSMPPLARQRRHRKPPAHRRRHAFADEDVRGGHGPRQSGEVVFPLPCRPALRIGMQAFSPLSPLPHPRPRSNASSDAPDRQP